MIISASRRTDIPSYYSDWLFNRIKEGFLYVRNPMNIHQISEISLSPNVVDGIVFWTKNPTPMLNRLDELSEYNYYFQFTLNPYGTDVETKLPSKNDVIIPTFQKLSSLIGKERVVWRYDPILINEKYSFEYHIKYFRLLAEKLASYTEKCTVSFLDLYKNTQRNILPLNISPCSEEQKFNLLIKFSELAKENGIYIDTCAENIKMYDADISSACCIDRCRFERIGNYKLNIEKDKSQRPECGCVASIDIGAYNTCKNGCLYCYANYSQKNVLNNSKSHNPISPLLFGEVTEMDTIKKRAMKSFKNDQLTLFD